MLSYNHGFHAGNHADILKHICLIYFIKSIKKSDNSIFYADTHAGCGIYPLENINMKKTKAYESGIGKLLNINPKDPYLRFYLKTIKNINKSNKIKFYPGSPKIVQYLTNTNDEIYFFEICKKEYGLLKKNFSKYANIKITNKDSFIILDKKIINQDKKGLILIDPSYEIQDDYQKVIKFIKENLTKFENKIIIVWYPVFKREDNNEFIEAFKISGIQNILRIEMPIKNDSDEKNMTGSGLIVFNSHKKTVQSLKGTILELQSNLQLKDNKKKVIVNYLR